MKVILDKAEASNILGQLIAQKLFPEMNLKVTSFSWSSYEDEVTIELEAPEIPHE